MEAIADMLEAVFKAIRELVTFADPILLSVGAVASVLIVGRIILIVTHNLSSIFRSFPEKQVSSLPPSPQPADSTDTLPTPQTQESPPVSAWSNLCIWIGLISTLLFIGYLVSQSAERGRNQAAKALVDSVAADVQAQRIALKPGVPQQDLPVRDPWGNPLQFFLHETSAGTLFVVRSSGPDEKMATADDLIGIKGDARIAKEFNDDLAIKWKEMTRRPWDVEAILNRTPEPQAPVAP